MKKFLLGLICATVLLLSASSAHADTSSTVTQSPNTTTQSSQTSPSVNVPVVTPGTIQDSVDSLLQGHVSNITLEQATEQMTQKLWTLYTLLLKVATPIAVIMFVFGAMLMFFGKARKFGIVTIVMVSVGFMVILSAPALLYAVTKFGKIS